VLGEESAGTFSRNSVYGNATIGIVIGDAAAGIVARAYTRPLFSST